MEIDDDKFGLYDRPHETEFQEIRFNPLTIYKIASMDVMNDESVHAPLLQYWNFLLTEDQNFYKRKEYKLMDIFGEVGGLMAIVSTAIIFALAPWNYKRHEINVMREFHDQNKSYKTFPKYLSLLLFVYDYLPCFSRFVY